MGRGWGAPTKRALGQRGRGRAVSIWFLDTLFENKNTGFHGREAPPRPREEDVNSLPPPLLLPSGIYLVAKSRRGTQPPSRAHMSPPHIPPPPCPLPISPCRRPVQKWSQPHLHGHRPTNISGASKCVGQSGLSVRSWCRALHLSHQSGAVAGTRPGRAVAHGVDRTRRSPGSVMGLPPGL